MRERLTSTSVQFTDKQFSQIETIAYEQKLKSNAEAVRIAWDYYVKHEYPELLKV